VSACQQNLIPLLNLQIWGAPTSQPAYDPANRNFIYQRFQRSIMHYDSTCNCNQGLLLDDNSGVGSAAIWHENGHLVGAAGSLKATELQKIVETLKAR